MTTNTQLATTQCVNEAGLVANTIANTIASRNVFVD